MLIRVTCALLLALNVRGATKFSARVRGITGTELDDLRPLSFKELNTFDDPFPNTVSLTSNAKIVKPEPDERDRTNTWNVSDDTSSTRSLDEDAQPTILWWPSAGISTIENVYDTCQDNVDPTACLKNKAANAFERLLSRNVTLADGFMLAKNGNVGTEASVASGDPDLRISNAIKRLLETHTFILDLSKYNDLGSERAQPEPRGKKKKKKKLKKMLMPVIMAGVAMMAVMGPMAIKSLYLIAGHALLASKIALVISGIVALKKLFAKDSTAKDTTLHIHAEDDRRRLVDLPNAWEDEFKGGFGTASFGPYGGQWNSNLPYSSSYSAGAGLSSPVMYQK